MTENFDKYLLYLKAFTKGYGRELNVYALKALREHWKEDKNRDFGSLYNLWIHAKGLGEKAEENEE